MADVIETDYSTDPPTVTERDFTPAEAAQRAADEALFAQMQAEAAAAEAARVTSIQDAQAELKAMGLSDNTIATISGYPYPYPPVGSDG